MILKEAEKQEIKKLQQQEQTCVQKYEKYSQDAKDPVLKELFLTIKKDEEKHYQTLEQILTGIVPSCDCNDSKGKNYKPIATYNQLDNSEDKKSDNFLATDSIGTEKMVSSGYNSGVFAIANSDIRKVLADIQIEEQNHADMIYKYRVANGMVEAS
ncbi:ferritin-like domain-containing protein [Anaerotignum sp.]|uniref:ferritin-like domain-containing protein n=1 Tax=Anaerotignum sp. TaxID=2039241 RepID=UPI0028AEFDFA|nr:ferritin-like domain-containing protein [Anaerotignum sp.]